MLEYNALSLYLTDEWTASVITNYGTYSFFTMRHYASVARYMLWPCVCHKSVFY